MQKLLNKFCFSDSKNGLIIIDIPTCTGKTHNTIEFIYKNYEKIENKNMEFREFKLIIKKPDTIIN